MEKKFVPQKIDKYEKIEMSDGTVIHQNQFIHTLNSTGLEIFELCDGKLTVQNIIDEMKKKYSDENIESIVKNFLVQLNESGLITF